MHTKHRLRTAVFWSWSKKGWLRDTLWLNKQNLLFKMFPWHSETTTSKTKVIQLVILLFCFCCLFQTNSVFKEDLHMRAHSYCFVFLWSTSRRQNAAKKINSGFKCRCCCCCCCCCCCYSESILLTKILFTTTTLTTQLQQQLQQGQQQELCVLFNRMSRDWSLNKAWVF